MQDQMISDNDVMQLLLDQHKYAACSLTQFALECTNMSLRNEVLRALDMTFAHQHHIFELMRQQGWYEPAMATPTDLAMVQNMFGQMNVTNV